MSTTTNTTSTISIDAATLLPLLSPSHLIPHLKSHLPSLSPSISTPARLSFPINPPPNSSLLLIMPSWSLHPSLPYLSVKLLTSFPSSSPSVHASLSLFHSLSGLPLAVIDATLLTLLRTASISALAAHSLVHSPPSTLLLIGCGALAPHLVHSHRHVHPSLKRVFVWNRTAGRARQLVSEFQEMEQTDPDHGSSFARQLAQQVEVNDAAVGTGKCQQYLGSEFQEEAELVGTTGTAGKAQQLAPEEFQETEQNDMVGTSALGFREMEGKGRAVVFEWVEDVDEVIGMADVVVCCTGSERAIVKGEMLKEGAHLSLVGSFRKDMRECDEVAVRRGRVFVDDWGAVEEAGELAGVEGVEVVGTLAELLREEVVGRRTEEEITVFKSVGSGVFDLLAAQLAYETYLKRMNS